MTQMMVPVNTMAPISVFGRGGAAAQFSRVKDGSPVTVLKHNQPEYVIMSVHDYEEIGLLRDELRELRNAEARRQALAHETERSFDSVDDFMEYVDAI